MPAACGRLYPADKCTYAIGRIAVRKDFRTLGFGRKIITALEQKASELGAEKITLSAQTNASGF
ncbi:MAG: GNAT family N-acetyltransferase, partial [Oscillospiraceae bacterium]|nr:GNAT family N-acetyltransferase [Oscillospiraceae bacterium]